MNDIVLSLRHSVLRQLLQKIASAIIFQLPCQGENDANESNEANEDKDDEDADEGEPSPTLAAGARIRWGMFFWMFFGCFFGCVLDVFWVFFGCFLDVFWMFC